MARKMARKLDEYLKAAVLLAVRGGSISRAEACKIYAVDQNELSLWERAFDEDGIVGLKDRRLNLRRPARRPGAPMNAQRAA